MKLTKQFVVSLFVLTALFCNNRLRAQDGSLDVSFNGNGKVSLPWHSVNNFDPSLRTAILANDEIIGAHTRYYGGPAGVTTLPFKINTNGTIAWGLDSSNDTIANFSAKGIVADDAHGRILFYGSANFNTWSLDSTYAQLAFIDTLGKPVLSVGTNGKITIDNTKYSLVAGAAFTSTGQILCLVQYPNAAQDSTFAYFTRIDTNGTVDQSFGNNGKAYIPVSNAYYVNFSLLSSGKMVYWANTNTFPSTAYTRCLQANGSPDLSFGNGGELVVDSLSPVNVLNDKLLFIYPTFSGNNFPAAMFNSGGTPYSAFGTNGRISLNLPSGYGFGNAIMQPDGKLLFGGMNNSDFGLMRLNTNGTLDNTFGTSGFVTTDFNGGLDGLAALHWQKHINKPVALGSGDQGINGFSTYVTAARYNVTVVSAIDEPVSEIKGLIYPNPATGKIYCSTKANITGVEIYNYLGALVKQSVQSTVDVSDLNSGMYLVMIKTSNGTQTEKLLKVD